MCDQPGAAIAWLELDLLVQLRQFARAAGDHFGQTHGIVTVAD